MNDAHRAAIETRFKTAWGSTTPIAYDNVAFTPPSAAPWVRLSILPVEEKQVTMAAKPTYRTTGIIALQIFGVKEKDGTSKVRQLAAQAAAVFRGQKFNGITCRDISMNLVGADGPYYQMNVSVEFFADTTY